MQPRVDKSADSRSLSDQEPQKAADKLPRSLGVSSIPGGQFQDVAVRKPDGAKGKGIRLKKPVAGVVLECTDRGTILKVGRDDVGLPPGLVPGVSLLTLVHWADLGKALAFIAEVKTRDLAFGWEMNISLAGRFTPLLFGGVSLNGHLLIAGSRTRSGLAHLLKHVMEPDRVSGMEHVIKEHAALAQAFGDPDLAVYEELGRVNQELIRLHRELAEKNAELERTVLDLRAAEAEVKTLQGFLPICTTCKKIRDDQGYWNQIEQYFHAHTGVGFTHSICPECLKTLYPDLYPKK